MRATTLLALGLSGAPLFGCRPDAVQRPTADSAAPGSTATGSAAAAPAPPNVELVRNGTAATLDEAARRALIARVEKALAVCNFSSGARPEIFGGDSLDALWKRREAASHLRLTYPAPMTISAVAGQLRFREVLLSIDQPYGPEPALVRDERGVVGLKKCGYDDRFLGCAPELSAYFPKPGACPPGQ